MKKDSLFKKSSTLGKWLGLAILIVLPAISIFFYQEIQSEKEKAFFVGEVEKLRREIQKIKIIESSPSAIVQPSQEPQIIRQTYEVKPDYSELISKLEEEKKCWTEAQYKLGYEGKREESCSSHSCAVKISRVEVKIPLTEEEKQEALNNLDEALDKLKKGIFVITADIPTCPQR